jgi:hypothetical protein
VTAPNPSPEVCHYGGLDSQAVVRTNDDGRWMSRCNCLTVTCASGTYDEAVAALEAHRVENS